MTVSDTDSECGMFFKSQKERCFAYSAHTACDERGFVLGMILTAGNVHDSTMLKTLLKQLLEKFQSTYAVVDAGYRTSANAYMLDELKIQGVMPYKNERKNKEIIPKYEFVYDQHYDWYICPEDQLLKLHTVDRNGTKHYQCRYDECRECPRNKECVSEKSDKRTIYRHVWADYMDEVDHFRLTHTGKMLYAARKETIERVFADAKEKHGMRFTRLKGLRKVEQETYLTFACLNLKKVMNYLKKKGDTPFKNRLQDNKSLHFLIKEANDFVKSLAFSSV